MADIDTILANVAGHDKTATSGPWEHNGRGAVWQVDGYAAGDPDDPDSRVAQANDADAALIAHYRTAAPLLAAEVERLRAEVERLTRDRDRLAGYVRAARRLSRDAHTHLLEDRPEETAQAIYRVICALASAEKEGDDQ
jgi:hypothetical protein